MMAITFKQEIAGIYPGYNDSYIIFTSSLSNHVKTEISVFPSALFPRPFILFPDLEGNYVFNLKDIVTTIFNLNNLEDSNFFNDSFYRNISGLYLEQALTIKVFNSTESEEITTSFNFSKSIRNPWEGVFSNPYQLLSNSKNGLDYNITYFEGFPFHVDILRAFNSVDIKVVNENTGGETVNMQVLATDSFRLNIDLSDGKNWTSSNVLPLINGINKLSIFAGGEFRTNLIVKKKKPCNGVYLKWLNSAGGYSHFLFHEFSTEEVKAKDLNIISNNDFTNVGSSFISSRSTGRTASDILKVRGKCDKNEAELLKDLFISPSVQLYSSRIANIRGEWINVTIQGNYKYNNKISNNRFSLSILLPTLETIKL